MNYNYFTPTGELIKEYVDARGITQKELSKRLCLSEKHISNFLSGKIQLTEEMAIKLEFIFIDIPASYWLNYEAKYREFLAKQEFDKDLENEDLVEISKKFKFKELFPKTTLSLVEQAKEVLKLLNISSFSNFESVYNNMSVSFFKDGGEKIPIILWIKICDREVDKQNNKIDDIEYSNKALKDNIYKFKNIALNSNIEESINTCRKLCNKLGIYLVVREALSNSKVRGVLTTYNNKPAIYISGRYKTHDNIWFVIIHELKHLLDSYDKKVMHVIFEEGSSIETAEEEANKFARDYFINPNEYNIFINKNDFSSTSLEKFAKDQKICVGILVGRLQHDGYIEKSKFNYKKDYIRIE